MKCCGVWNGRGAGAMAGAHRNEGRSLKNECKSSTKHTGYRVVDCMEVVINLFVYSSREILNILSKCGKSAKIPSKRLKAVEVPVLSSGVGVAVDRDPHELAPAAGGSKGGSRPPTSWRQ